MYLLHLLPFCRFYFATVAFPRAVVTVFIAVARILASPSTVVISAFVFPAVIWFLLTLLYPDVAGLVAIMEVLASTVFNAVGFMFAFFLSVVTIVNSVADVTNTVRFFFCFFYC